MTIALKPIGEPASRVDGPKKVTGQAKYAGEFAPEGMIYGVVVSSTVAKGRITGFDLDAAGSLPGVVKIVTHENRPKTAWFSASYKDETAPPGTPFRPLYDEQVHYSGQPIALVVAEDFETARYAASLVGVSYASEPHETDLKTKLAEAYVPKKARTGIDPPPKPRGDPEGAFENSARKISTEYHLAVEHHNPMEPHATTVSWDGDGRITVYDKTQGVHNIHAYVTSVFSYAKDKVRVMSPFVGGAFGSGLRPQYQVFLAVMAATDLERSVRVTLTRQQMFTFVYRADVHHTVSLGANEDGRLDVMMHDAVARTSRFEDYQENIVNWGGLLYLAPNARQSYRLAALDNYTPGDMRAPGAAQGVYALEVAMDELAYETGIDPLELRFRNYSSIDQNTGKRFSSKSLRACYHEGAERFGWAKRKPKPRSMRDGKELIGWGMASGVWESGQMKTSARAVLSPDGTLEVASGTADIGTGTYTIMAQIGAGTLGLPLAKVTALLGDSSLPKSPVEGGSWMAASVGTAVQDACLEVGEQLLKLAGEIEGSPLGRATIDEVVFADERIALRDDASKSVALADLLRKTKEPIRAEVSSGPGLVEMMRPPYSRFSHSAVFAEVRVDEEIGVIRVQRVVNAVAAGRILNPKTARSQIIGGIVMGIGQALEEETMIDHRFGRFMNHSLAEYHVPVNADIHDIDVIFVEERDPHVNALGIKGVGEIGIVGTAAAIANAVHHATGVRVRDLPITLDKLLI